MWKVGTLATEEGAGGEQGGIRGWKEEKEEKCKKEEKGKAICGGGEQRHPYFLCRRLTGLFEDC